MKKLLLLFISLWSLSVVEAQFPVYGKIMRTVPVIFRSEDYGATFQLISLDNVYIKVGAYGTLAINANYFDYNKLFVMFPVSKSDDSGSNFDWVDLVGYYSKIVE